MLAKVCDTHGFGVISGVEQVGLLGPECPGVSHIHEARRSDERREPVGGKPIPLLTTPFLPSTVFRSPI